MSSAGNIGNGIATRGFLISVYDNANNTNAEILMMIIIMMMMMMEWELNGIFKNLFFHDNASCCL